MTAFRSIVSPDKQVPLTVDGKSVAAPRGQSLLAFLLAAGMPGAAADFHCAIGQCQRCLVRVDGRVRAACLYVPKGGETIDTGATDGRAPAWTKQGPHP